jgi:hypothetical protein
MFIFLRTDIITNNTQELVLQHAGVIESMRNITGVNPAVVTCNGCSQFHKITDPQRLEV